MSTCNPCSTSQSGIIRPGFPPPVGSSTSSSSGTSGSTTPSGTDPATGCPLSVPLPVVAANFTVPAVGGAGQLQSLCAYLWAIPGNVLVFQPLGQLQVTGVSGDVITYVNQTMPAGFQVLQGTLIFQDGPITASSFTPAAQLDKLHGELAGAQKTLAPGSFAFLRGIPSGGNIFYQNVNGLLFNPQPAPLLLDDPGFVTNPIATVGAGGTATYTLPGLPSALPPTFGVQLRIALRDPTLETTYANGFTVSYLGAEITRLQAYGITQDVIIPATSNSIQLAFAKFSGRANCVAEIFLLGYFN